MKKKIERFEDLEVWKVSMQLAVAVYEALAQCRDFGLRRRIAHPGLSRIKTERACGASGEKASCR
ncbi:MAG: hypothetical protein ABIZ49_09190 [Opitutaceae bacterium]